MHEMSIIEALLETVRGELQSRPHTRLRTVHVRIGRLRFVEPTALQFCYNAAVQDTSFADSRLEIQRVEAQARCNECSLEFPVEENWFECPRCGSGNARLLKGDELLLSSMELEETSLDLEPTDSHVHCN